MIYIACPGMFATGGTELLHQLYYKLKKYTDNVKIFYYNITTEGNPINKRFEKYNVEYVCNIIDLDINVLIVPEIATDQLKYYKKIHKIIWWLSVDNYYHSLGYDKNILKFLYYRGKKIINGEYKRKLIDFEDDILHLCQSYYAKSFLEKKGVKKIAYLSDYIGSNFINEMADFTDKERGNIVLYNPMKGIKFTRRLIKYSNNENIKYVPLENMNQERIIYLCKTSKVYIDFGNHPGKDRFPREAAHLGCIIITGKKGSANYYNDVMIPDRFKFNDDIKLIPNIVNQIKSILNNYNDYVNLFNEYRQMIINEEKLFEDDVINIWKNYLEPAEKTY